MTTIKRGGETVRIDVERVKTLVAEQGWTQSEFAEAAGITQGAVSRIFNGGRAGSSLNFLEAIHNAFPQEDIRGFLIFDGVPRSESG